VQLLGMFRGLIALFSYPEPKQTLKCLILLHDKNVLDVGGPFYLTGFYLSTSRIGENLTE
jgi:hypothetical protein